jgi:hypothetical protein
MGRAAPPGALWDCSYYFFCKNLCKHCTPARGSVCADVFAASHSDVVTPWYGLCGHRLNKTVHLNVVLGYFDWQKKDYRRIVITDPALPNAGVIAAKKP